MRTALAAGALLAVLTAQDEQSKVELYDLRFEPRSDRLLEVSYAEKTTWDYRKLAKPIESHGRLETDLVLHWDFATKGPGLQAVGSFRSVRYAGKGQKRERQWTHDVLWSRDKGYERGENGEAVKTWVGGEVEEGVRFAIDERVAASPGEC